MSPGPLVVTGTEYTTRLRAILGPGHAGGLPRRQRDVWILLHAITQRVAIEPAATEREFTTRLQDFLIDHGQGLRLDAASLRRALVDEGFVDRDDNGRDYRVSTRHARRVTFDGRMPGIEEALTRK